MSQIYLIADTHFGHNGISHKFRQEFKDDLDHDETIFHNIMMCSGKRNHLWLLGDICFKVDTLWRLDAMRHYWGSVNVVMGNHEHKKLASFCVRQDIAIHGIIKKWGFFLSHAPIHPQEIYRARNIHGHVHRNTVPDSNYFNVSCENLDYKPITLQEIRKRMDG